MKICFKIHPDDFDKAANEKFYEEMASKGWLLKKRGANLSKFEKIEPQQLKFDIYYSKYNYVSSEEKAEFEESGRTAVNVRSNVHVSYAPKNAALPSVIKSNEDVAKTIIPLKNRRSVLPAPIVFILMFNLLSNIRIKFTYNAFETLPFIEKLLYKIITMPELYIILIIIVAYVISVLLYKHLRWKKAVKIFQNGDNPDDGIRKKVLYIFNLFIIGLSVIFIALFAYSDIRNSEQDIPEFSDGIYLDVHDFGIADKITKKGTEIAGDHFPCRMLHRKTLSSEMCLTQEYYHINDTRIIVYQDVIKYKSPKTALYAAELLASEKYADYKETEAEGFEKVYLSEEDLVAVIGNTTYRLTYITTEKSLIPASEQLLDAILEKHTD